MSLELLQQQAKEAGFDAVGVAPVETLARETSHLREWLQEGWQGEMHYMERNIEKRENPVLLVENARSVIVTLTNYYTPRLQAENTPLLARYAYGKDYHRVVKGRLQELRTRMGGIEGRCFVDSAPVFEHEWARRAGLGWLGKNTLLIHPEKGSFCFIGVILTPAVFDFYSTPYEKQHCGNCSRCIEACPTGALVPHRLDARKCISYQTIENKGEYPPELKQKAGFWIFGCDLCQEACPWNKRSPLHTVPDFLPKEEILELRATDWMQMDETTFKRLFENTPLERTGLARIRRNLNE